MSVAAVGDLAREAGTPRQGATGAAVPCAHCGLPVPEPLAAAAAARNEADVPRFCCTGCEAVWHSLHACGLERFYELQRAAGERANRPSVAASHAWLDHADFAARHVTEVAAGRLRAELRIDGLKCGACLWLLEALPRLAPGLLESRVDVGRAAIALEWQAGATSLGAVAERIAALGYSVRPMGAAASREEWRRQDRRWLVDIGVAGAISGNVMAIAFALYGAQLTWMDDTTRQFLQWTSAALAGLAVAWPGRIYLRNAWSALRTRTPHMDLPIALALLAGLVGGTWMTASGRPGVYFESVSMLVFLLLAGRFVQFRQQRRARHEIELLCALVPQVARRVEPDGRVVEVPSEALRAGDVVEVPAGESVPADGVLQGSASHLDLQLLTGESRPVRVAVGDAVHAGVRTTSAPVRVRVTAAGDATRAAAIARMVEDAAGRRPPVVEFANRIAGWFLVAVIAITTATGVAWWFIDPVRMPGIVIAMLVVTCPCALGLATPLTMVAALGKAARAGILVRGGDVLERLAAPGTLVLDKTGTVTEGAMRVMRVEGDAAALARAVALESRSIHPVAQAIVAWGRDSVGSAVECAQALDVSCVREVAGRGIEGMVDGAMVAVGSRSFVAGDGGSLERSWSEAADAMEADGLSPVFVRVDRRTCAVVGAGDPVRRDAASLVGSLGVRGWSVWLCSGDVPALATRVGEAIGIPAGHSVGGRSPEEKLSFVATQDRHPVVMVGDGVNDLPAMAAADVGIAVRQGAQATVERADVALTGGGLAQVVSLLDGARRTMRTIHVNFAISVGYNVVGAVLAATGTINPLIAAVMMPLSGLTVTAVALRIPRFRAP